MARIISSRSTRPRGPGLFSRPRNSSVENANKTDQLIRELNSVIARSMYPTRIAQERLAHQLVFDVFGADPFPTNVRQSLTAFALETVRQEMSPLYEPPDRPPANDALAAYDLRNEIQGRLEYFDKEAEYITTWRDHLRFCLQKFSRALQGRRPGDGTLSITVPLYTTLPDPAGTVDEIVRRLFKLAPSNPKEITVRPGTRLGAAVLTNVLAASRLTFEDAQKRPYRIIWPAGTKLSPAELVDTYLDRTPFATHLNTDVELSIPNNLLPEGGLITAFQGHGKTQLLQWMVLRFLENPERPSLIIMDSQGDAQKVISRLRQFDPALGNNISIIDPTDIHPPALNLFGWNRELAATLSQQDRETLLNGVNEMFMIIFDGFFGTALTPHMRLVFQYLTLWMMQIENANVHTLIEILTDPTPYFDYVDRLPVTAQTFIEELFSERSQYKKQIQLIRGRLHHIIVNPAFERMFAHTENKFDIGAAMNTPGHVTFINTSKGSLKNECSAIFGRFWLAKIFQATMERTFIPRAQRGLSIALIDEAHEYLQGAENTVAQLLYQARKYRVSINLIHQDLDQFKKAGVLGTTLGVPALRFTGTLSDADANLLAKEMNTTPEFLKSVHKTDSSAEWAVFARNITPTATKTTIKFLEAEWAPKMSDQTYRRLLELNRQRIGAPRRPQNVVRNNTHTPPTNDGDSY